MQGPGPLSATWATLDLPASLEAEASIKAVSRPNFFCPVLFAYLPSLSQLLSPVINLLYANLHLRVGFLVSPTCDTFLVPSVWDSPPSMPWGAAVGGVSSPPVACNASVLQMRVPLFLGHDTALSYTWGITDPWSGQFLAVPLRLFSTLLSPLNFHKELLNSGEWEIRIC